ncbi:WD40 repeat domain-containing protein [Streptomyces sp. NPDC002078]
MRPSSALLAGLLLAGACTLPASAAESADGAGDHGFTLKDPRIAESSGLAASHLHPGIYWTHNDSGDGPYIYAVDSRTGKTVARITLRGIGTPRDDEAISIGPHNEIYLGDIGDNYGGRWPYVWIYRLPEPAELKDQTVTATQYVVKYANGPRDAESLIVHPKTGRVYIIDKKEDGGHLYEGPATLSTSGANIFEPIAPVDLWATDAAFSPDGRQLAVRGYLGGIYYDWNGGRIKREGQLDVPLQGQGEGVSYSPDGTELLYSSEGAGSEVVAKQAPGRPGAKSPSASASSGSAGSAAGGAAGSGDGLKAGAAVVVAVGLAALFGLRRLRRRG